MLFLVDVSDFFFFSGRGGIGGSPRRQGAGGSVFIENPRRGGGSRSGRGRGAGRVSAANWGILGGGLNSSFSGPADEFGDFSRVL